MTIKEGTNPNTRKESEIRNIKAETRRSDKKKWKKKANLCFVLHTE